MSISTQIMEYVSSVPDAQRQHMSAQEIGDAIGHSSGKVSKLLWSLEHTGRLRLIRDGRAIVGVEEVIRTLPTPASERSRGAATSPRARQKQR